MLIITLLRGINVGGNKKIKMADLRDLYSALGFQKTQTLLQSGNAVCETDMTDLEQIRHTLETGIEEKLGFDVTVILRTPDDFKQMLSAHPFTDQQISDPAKISFVFLDKIPSDNAVTDLKDKNTGNEIIHHQGRELFIFYADGKGKSKLDNGRIERTLQCQATARNWNTVQKIMDLIEST